MADDQPSDEQRLYTAFQELAKAVLPLEQELRQRAFAMLGAFLGVTTLNADVVAGSAPQPTGQRSPPRVQIASREPPSPKDFLFQKQPNTDVERVACIAYYLTHYRGTKHFKTLDISKLNTEAAQRKFANPASTVNNATQAGFLAPVSSGMKQLAAEGERFVDELPDRAAAKAAFGNRKARRQRKQSSTDKAGARAQAPLSADDFADVLADVAAR